MNLEDKLNWLQKQSQIGVIIRTNSDNWFRIEWDWHGERFSLNGKSVEEIVDKAIQTTNEWMSDPKYDSVR